MSKLASVLLILLLPLFAPAETLRIHFVDVEGGQATLIVTPSGESMLVDAGWPGFEGRDADRIVKAARKAGLARIDYILVTHYHTDHVGGVPQVIERIPVGRIIDHGSNTETGANAEKLAAAYHAAIAGLPRAIVRPGDRLPLKDVEAMVVSSRGELIRQPLRGAGARNSLCADAERKGDDPTENGKSIGFVLTYGKFSFINLADLTWNLELDLACPANLLGTADVYLTTHHGMHTSGPPALVHALRPRVAIMNNGFKKGGSPEAWRIIRTAPGLEDFWQLHYALAGGAEHNVPEVFIANPGETDQGHNIELEARSDGSFKVTNVRNGHTVNYGPRP